MMNSMNAKSAVTMMQEVIMFLSRLAATRFFADTWHSFLFEASRLQLDYHTYDFYSATIRSLGVCCFHVSLLSRHAVARLVVSNGEGRASPCRRQVHLFCREHLANLQPYSRPGSLRSRKHGLHFAILSSLWEAEGGDEEFSKCSTSMDMHVDLMWVMANVRIEMLCKSNGR